MITSYLILNYVLKIPFRDAEVKDMFVVYVVNFLNYFHSKAPLYNVEIASVFIIDIVQARRK